MMSLDIILLNTISRTYKIYYELVPSFEDAELLARLLMSQKEDHELVFISPGWYREIKGDELKIAIELAKKYRVE